MQYFTFMFLVFCTCQQINFSSEMVDKGYCHLSLSHTHTTFEHLDDVGVWVFFLTIKQDTSKTTVGQNYR